MAKINLENYEDFIRNQAMHILGFDDNEPNVTQGTGQIMTMNQLGFTGFNEKPDGWYIPENKTKPVIILETKATNIDIYTEANQNQLFKYVDIVNTKYPNTIGILYNGESVRVFKNKEELDCSDILEHKSYYLKLFSNVKIDKEAIYAITKRINDMLHFKFGMTKLQDRMIFTACALVAQRFNSNFISMKGNKFNTVKEWIVSTIRDSFENDENQSKKIRVLLEEFKSVKVSITNNQDAIDGFVESVCSISDLVNSDNWNGEDVMAIFFNEFNRYKSKSDAGQVFTPDHITSFMYHLIDCNKNDRILDATCGSGAFLVKAMCNMVNEVGGNHSERATDIRENHLFGIELYRDVFALACANMLIHQDGRSNLVQLDSTSEEAGNWIKDKNITKVLMNPPYERKYGCMKIVANVLDNVPIGTKCAFIMPEKQLEKNNGEKLLEKHTLTTIIKMPEDLFFGVGVTTSIYVFESGKPQLVYKKGADGKRTKVATSNIKAYYIEDDGLQVVKNKGRQDTRDTWSGIEQYWLNSIKSGKDEQYNTMQEFSPLEHMSYQNKNGEFAITQEELVKAMIDFSLFNSQINTMDALINLLT